MGQPVAGRWTLHLTDHAGQDTGRLDRWRLQVDPTAAPTVIEAAATLPAGGLATPDAQATGITSTITVTQAAVLTQAQVTVDVRYSFIGDPDPVVLRRPGHRWHLDPPHPRRRRPRHRPPASMVAAPVHLSLLVRGP
jgi:subtilisin-like proprotein convertase family protein